MEETGDVVSEEYDLEEAVGTLFVPEGVWGASSALVISWINVLGISDILVSLSKARDFCGNFIPVWHDESTKLVWNGVVKGWKRDEEFLPQESEANFHDHSKEFVDNFFLFAHWNAYVSDGSFELWEI